tara:strand:+ start:1532 stop:2185 length:654 start_codon:yes stop_codon:yes gene_type:complete
MAANPVFKKVLLKDIEFQYPRLDNTYRFNSQDQRSEPCSPTAQGAAWSISWSMSHEDAKSLHGELTEHYSQCAARDTTLPAFSKIFGMKKLDDGRVTFRAKKNGTNRNGDANQPPIVIGADKQPLADKAIWTGSKGTLRVVAFPSKSPQGEGGITLLLDAVQVTEPAYGGDGLDDFDQVAPAKPDAQDDPFGLPPIKSDPPQSKVSADRDLDDEIPF